MVGNVRRRPSAGGKETTEAAPAAGTTEGASGGAGVGAEGLTGVWSPVCESESGLVETTALGKVSSAAKWREGAGAGETGAEKPPCEAEGGAGEDKRSEAEARVPGSNFLRSWRRAQELASEKETSKMSGGMGSPEIAVSARSRTNE